MDLEPLKHDSTMPRCSRSAAARVTVVAVALVAGTSTSSPGSGLASSGLGARSDLIAFERYAPYPKDRILLMNADGSEQRVLADGCCFDWSPDGTRIAFVDSDSVNAEADSAYVINVDGSGLRLVTRGDVRRDGTGHSLPPDWSPDGRRIVYAGRDGIYSVSADGTRRERLTAPDHYDSSPTWSADGRKIAFERYLPDPRGFQIRPSSPRLAPTIYVMNADGSGERRLVSGALHRSPVWAPNRPTIAFEYWDGERGLRKIAVINAEGSGFRTLTKDRARESGPTWSPNGRRIAFDSAVARPGSESDIHVINRDGSRHRNLTPRTRSSDHDSNWSSDGRRIAFVSTRGGDRNIFVMTASGRDLTKLAASSWNPSWTPSRN